MLRGVAALPQAQAGIVDFKPLDVARVPRRLRVICRKALACQPQDRFKSAEEFGDSLKLFLRLRRILPVALAALLILAIGFSILFYKRAPGPIHEGHAGPAPEAIIDPLKIEIQHVDGTWKDLSEAGRIGGCDKINAQVSIARGYYGAMLLFDRATSQPHILAECGPDDQKRTLEIPPPKGPNLSGDSGTKVIAVVVRQSAQAKFTAKP